MKISVNQTVLSGWMLTKIKCKLKRHKTKMKDEVPVGFIAVRIVQVITSKFIF